LFSHNNRRKLQGCALNLLHQESNYHLDTTGCLTKHLSAEHFRAVLFPGQVKIDLFQVVSFIWKNISDKSFCKDDSGLINLWKLYNLFTGAKK